MEPNQKTAAQIQKKPLFFWVRSWKFIAFSFVILLATLFGALVLFIGSVQRQALSAQNEDVPIYTPRVTPTSVVDKHEVIGFLPSWTPAANVNLSKTPLTQLIYFGLGVTENGDIIKFNEAQKPVLEWSNFISDEFAALQIQAQKQGVKVLISIKNFDNESIDRLISNTTATQRFSKQLVQLITEYRLDGVNFDFEYVTDSEFPTHTYLNKFLEKIISDVQKDDRDTIISLDVNATAVIKDAAYDMVKIGELVDQVIIMGYDYHTVRSTVAGHIAPLYSSGSAPSVHKSLESLKGRVAGEKIILGAPFYGYEWETVSDKIRSATIQNTGALATYKRIQDLLTTRKKDIKTHWDDRAQAPWLSYKQSGVIKQIYYEDTRSLGKKKEYVKEQELGGMAIWALGYEGKHYAIWNVFR